MNEVLRMPFAFRVDQKLRTCAIALILVATTTLSACWFKPQWIAIAEQDLPVIISMAESIASLIALTKTVQAPSPSEVAAIQHIGDVATQGLQAIQTAYQDYTSKNATTTIAQIQAGGAALVENLNQLLAAAQIKDQFLLNRVTAAVQLIVSTLNTFLALVPQVAGAKKAKLNKSAAAAMPSASTLRQMWADQVGTPLVKR